MAKILPEVQPGQILKKTQHRLPVSENLLEGFFTPVAGQDGQETSKVQMKAGCIWQWSLTECRY